LAAKIPVAALTRRTPEHRPEAMFSTWWPVIREDGRRVEVMFCKPEGNVVRDRHLGPLKDVVGEMLRTNTKWPERKKELDGLLEQDDRIMEQVERLYQLIADRDFGMFIYRRARPLKDQIKDIWFPLNRVVKARKRTEADSDNPEEEKESIRTDLAVARSSIGWVQDELAGADAAWKLHLQWGGDKSVGLHDWRFLQ
jgi:hypothetical protein